MRTRFVHTRHLDSTGSPRVNGAVIRDTYPRPGDRLCSVSGTRVQAPALTCEAER